MVLKNCTDVSHYPGTQQRIPHPLRHPHLTARFTTKVDTFTSCFHLRSVFRRNQGSAIGRKAGCGVDETPTVTDVVKEDELGAIS
jgi:hypothetical protein